MTRRDFLYTSSDFGSLSQNKRHNFALSQTMRIYGTQACCTWIPKNACSTLRFSVAKANGCVSDLSDIHWIHANNRTFNATTETAFTSAYTFVVLRCPFSRIISAFLNKFVDMSMSAWQLRKALDRKIHPHDLTFRTFLQTLQDIPMPRFDIHMRQQVDFLLFRKYDDYFTLENFEPAIETIADKAGLRIYDTREALGHDTSKRKMIPDMEAPMDSPAVELLVHKRKGVLPEPASLLDDECVDIIARVWAKDLTFYKRKFGASELMQRFA